MPHMDPVNLITYEYPLIERVRTLLRIEDLFDRMRDFVAREEPHSHHAALVTLFEILEVGGRADLKSDLLQELDRQKQTMLAYRGKPEIDSVALARILDRIETTATALRGMTTGKIGQHLRENEWLMAIKQRSSIPGGTCEFDLPSYHHWLHRPAATRTKDLETWIAPLAPLHDGAAIVLQLLRQSGKPVSAHAAGGNFQQMLGGRVAQLARLRLSAALAVIPEISANKYALNVRFTTFDRDMHPRPISDDVDFELTFCSL